MKFDKLNKMAVREWLALTGAVQAAQSGMLHWVFLFGSDLLDLRISKTTYGSKI